MDKPNILFMMSGSIACAKATGLISEWVKRGHAVRVASTASVAEFVGRGTLEGLSGQPVFDDHFESGRVMDHIALARWAGTVVVCPATSNLINKLAAGIADDAVTTLWQAAWGRGLPLFIVPAMNTRMWNYPATRESIARLQRWGVHVLPTARGDLACGENGDGRMLEPVDILATIEGLLAFDAATTGQRVLVTGGGTREPIDSVRYIGNHSSGRTAAVLADSLAARGHRVTWLGARHALAPGEAVSQTHFESFADLDRRLGELLGQDPYDVVIHAAAVSDFSVAGVTADDGGSAAATGDKLASSGGLTVRLATNPKLLGRIREYSCNPAVKVVGFKLTSGADEAQARAAVERLFRQAGTHAVVHNDLARISGAHHAYTLYLPDRGARAVDDSRSLARAIEEWMEHD